VSHVVSIKTEVRDVDAIRAACRRLNIDQPEQGTFKLFSGEATGIAVRLPDWTYPVVCDVATGEMNFENYNGRWGDQNELDAFLQGYAVEKARLEAHKRGHTVTEQPLADGSVKLTIQVNGGGV
jgi:hypothetical protein